MKNLLLALLLGLASGTSFALENFTGKITVVEPTYLPSAVTFIMDTGNSTCPSGTWLKWQNADSQNNKAIYATLITAMATGKQVRFVMNNGDLTCKGQYLHFIN